MPTLLPTTFITFVQAVSKLVALFLINTLPDTPPAAMPAPVAPLVPDAPLNPLVPEKPLVPLAPTPPLKPDTPLNPLIPT